MKNKTDHDNSELVEQILLSVESPYKPILSQFFKKTKPELDRKDFKNFYRKDQVRKTQKALINFAY